MINARSAKKISEVLDFELKISSSGKGYYYFCAILNHVDWLQTFTDQRKASTLPVALYRTEISKRFHSFKIPCNVDISNFFLTVLSLKYYYYYRTSKKDCLWGNKLGRVHFINVVMNYRSLRCSLKMSIIFENWNSPEEKICFSFIFRSAHKITGACKIKIDRKAYVVGHMLFSKICIYTLYTLLVHVFVFCPFYSKP